MKCQKLLIKYPSRQRPQLFQKTLNKYIEFLSGEIEYEFIITLDEDDGTMNNPEIIAFLDDKKNLKYFYGDSKTKIEAVNADIPMTGWDVVLVISDDMTPVVKGYDKVIIDNMNKHYPDGDGCLFFTDMMHGRDKLWTLPIISNKYYNKYEPFVYDEKFKSVFCDNWAQFLAEDRKKLTYIPIGIIRHDWVQAFGKDDKLFKRNSNPETYNRDQKVFEKLKEEYMAKKKITKVEEVKEVKQEQEVLFSILTLTIEGRKILLNKLKAIIEPQLVAGVEWLIEDTAPPVTIGEKRQRLLEKANGKYIAYIDDDDEVSLDYVQSILTAINEDKDVVGFRGVAYKDGKFDRKFIASNLCESWQTTPNLYRRSVYHLNAVKKSLAIQVGFEFKNFGEDLTYSLGLKPLIKTESFIDKDLYYYHWRSQVSTCNNINNNKRIISEHDASIAPVAHNQVVKNRFGKALYNPKLVIGA